MSGTADPSIAAAGANAPGLEELRRFVEHEAELLDERRFDEWCDLYTEDAAYWVPASPDQENWRDHVSLFYDDKHTMRTRVQRLNHPRIHCQSPPSRCVRVVSGVRLDEAREAGAWIVRSKFVMVEDRPGAPQRVFGGRYAHSIVQEEGGLRIRFKRVDLTNCDQSFPMLTQPF